MIKHKLDDFIGGWFIGDFFPSLLQTSNFEIAIKSYQKGDIEKKHLHKIATEYTVIVIGCVKMNDFVYYAGDIIEILPNEPTDFEALTDAITVVVKTPSVKPDKYIIE